ncbi:uncharacterized protein PAF06_007914 [Gastrophryne carolinensis]
MGHSYICYEGPLGAHLKAEVKEKIWKREYIDIFTLLPLERFNVDRWKEGGEGRKEEEEDRRRLRMILRTFGNWLQAFAIMGSVIGEKSPGECSALFCYLDAVWEAHRVYGGTAWLKYDEQFRQRMSVRPELGTFDSFGVPVATEKTEGPRTCMSFLGIEIDSQAGVCRLPLVKVRDLLQELQGALLVKKVTLRQLQSVLGKLNFVCKVLPMGRVFSRRLSLATAGVKEAHHFIRLTGGLKEDLRMWVSFLSSFNGLVYWLDPVRENREVGLFTDAAGSTGFGAYFAGRWCATPWPERVRSSSDIRNLALLELFPVVVALALWGEDLQNKSVLFHSVNMAVVSAINAQTASSPPVVKLLRQLVLSCLQYNILFRAVHVPGVANGIADALSRFQMDRFRELAPEACTEGEECPDWVWRLI